MHWSKVTTRSHRFHQPPSRLPEICQRCLYQRWCLRPNQTDKISQDSCKLDSLENLSCPKVSYKDSRGFKSLISLTYHFSFCGPLLFCLAPCFTFNGYPSQHPKHPNRLYLAWSARTVLAKYPGASEAIWEGRLQVISHCTVSIEVGPCLNTVTVDFLTFAVTFKRFRLFRSRLNYPETQ